MKQFVLKNVEVVIETQQDDLTEAEALEQMQLLLSRFQCKGVGHRQDGTIVFLFSDDIGR